MKKVCLTQGKFALVDDEDYEWLSKYKWHLRKGLSNNYAGRRYDTGKYEGYYKPIKLRKNTFMHRAIMGVKKGFEIDHINGDGLDNRRENLRFCTRRQNSQNQKIPKHNTSGYKGVGRYNNHKKWTATITVSGRVIRLGSFNNILLAAHEYNKAAIKYFGEYARLNPISKHVGGK